MVGSPRQGWVIFAAMLILILLLLLVIFGAEYAANPVLGVAGVMEGKETRFGIANSILWGSATTSASNGSVNAMHSSFSPLAGGVALLNILLGRVIFGGVGAGLYGMLVFVILTVFIAGLMVALIEGAKRQKTPNEIALTILLSGLTIIFLLAVVSLRPFATYAEAGSGLAQPTTTIPIPIALLVCLIATTIGGLLSAHKQILREIWGPEYVEEIHYLRVYFAQLRQILEEDPSLPKLILTEPGVGYRLVA